MDNGLRQRGWQARVHFMNFARTPNQHSCLLQHKSAAEMYVSDSASVKIDGVTIFLTIAMSCTSFALVRIKLYDLLGTGQRRNA